MSRHLNFLARGQHYAVPVECVQEILAIKQITEIPSRLPALRGGINIRGSVLPLFDFRTIVGHPKLIVERTELVGTLAQREQDHIDWLEALMKTVREGVEFRKATDPRACAFGKWYYSYKAPDSSVERTLVDFEAPHNEIHALALKVIGMCQKGESVQAIKLVEHARTTTLTRLLGLFSDLKSSLLSDLRELALICRGPDGSRYALAVDSVENIRDFEKEGFQSRASLESGSAISRIWSTDRQAVMELDREYLEKLLPGTERASA